MELFASTIRSMTHMSYGSGLSLSRSSLICKSSFFVYHISGDVARTNRPRKREREREKSRLAQMRLNISRSSIALCCVLLYYWYEIRRKTADPALFLLKRNGSLRFLCVNNYIPRTQHTLNCLVKVIDDVWIAHYILTSRGGRGGAYGNDVFLHVLTLIQFPCRTLSMTVAPFPTLTLDAGPHFSLRLFQAGRRRPSYASSVSIVYFMWTQLVTVVSLQCGERSMSAWQGNCPFKLLGTAQLFSLRPLSLSLPCCLHSSA